MKNSHDVKIHPDYSGLLPQAAPAHQQEHFVYWSVSSVYWGLERFNNTSAEKGI